MRRTMVDQKFLKSVFTGDNAAFQRLYVECRDLFMAYFTKHYPDSKVQLPDLYQDSVMELWSQIVDGRIHEGNLKCSLSTYILSIGINKMREGIRCLRKHDKLVDAMKNHTTSYMASGGVMTPVLETNDYDGEKSECLHEWAEFLKSKYEELGYPCNQLLRDTWYNNMTDSDILEASGGYFANTNVVKTKRYKCHKVLLNMFNAWKISQN